MRAAKLQCEEKAAAVGKVSAVAVCRSRRIGTAAGERGGPATAADGRSLRRFSLLHSPAGLGAIARAPEAGSVAPESWRAVVAVAMSAKCGGVGGFGRLKTHARSQKGRLKGRAAPATDRASPASGREQRRPCRERAAQNWTSHAQTKLGSSEMCSVLTLPHAPPGGRRQRGARACQARTQLLGHSPPCLASL